jgi:hypothetical protein
MSGTPYDSNLPVPNGHMEVLYRQTYNTLGQATATDFTQNNVTNSARGSTTANTTANGGRLGTTLGVLAGSVVAVDITGDNLIGPCAGDSTTAYDMAVGIAINDAVGNPFESSSGIASERIVYCHGNGTVFKTDIYETYVYGGSSVITYTAGDLLYASKNGLLVNASGMQNSPVASAAALGHITVVGICLKAPAGSSDPYMMVQLKI